MSAAPPLMQQFYDMLLESQFWSRQQLVDYQRSQLEHLLRHARANVPFYETRLDPVFRPDGSVDWDKWEQIPIVKRADLAERGTQMLARVLPVGHGPTTSSTTSGSTGAPIKVVSNQLAHVALNANRFRSYRWHGIDWSKDVCSVFSGDPRVGPSSDGMRLGPWGPSWDPASIDGCNTRINSLAEYPRIIEFLLRIQPTYLTTGARTAMALALEAERLGADIRLEALLSHGSTVGQAERDVLKRVFGAKVVDLYSSKEGAQIAHACPLGGGMHVNAESILVEIVDDEGRPCADNVAGRVVITPFFNTAQPLIRYEQGDFATLLPGCECGRHLPLLGHMVGRSYSIFFHPDGSVRTGLIPTRYRSILNCGDWQVAQTGPLDFEVRYVPLDWDSPGNEAEFTERFREVYFSDANVRFKRVREIPVSKGGKLIEYVNEWRAVE